MIIQDFEVKAKDNKYINDIVNLLKSVGVKIVKIEGEVVSAVSGDYARLVNHLKSHPAVESVTSKEITTETSVNVNSVNVDFASMQTTIGFPPVLPYSVSGPSVIPVASTTA